ncbi:uncharacterized protein [Anabrus simplex]|uniref:uncharacterized protein n=1 Tax=Anabrus simplex TaxID=316456 RepID=UPI0035A26505
MSRYSRYPYQNATTAAHASHQPQIISHQQQLRNPWISEPAPLRPSQLDCRESQSTNSSSSSRTYCGIGGSGLSVPGPGPPPHWLQHHNHHPHPRAAHYAVLDHHAEVLDAPPMGPGSHLPNAVVPGPVKPHTHAHPQQYASSSRAASDRGRPITPTSSPGGASGSDGGGAVDGCGGHCVAFENFCYYCLQVIFIAGILTGVSLTIAGSVLRSQQRGSDLLVLVYIGCMLAMVCALLLSVQCCVRRNVKRRKRALRASRAGCRRLTPGASGHNQQPHSSDMIPLQELGKPTQPQQQQQQQQQHPQYQPLLMRLVQQQTADNQRHQQQQQFVHHNYRGGGLVEDGEPDGPMDTSRSGTPWWRRRGDMRPHVIESRH